MKVNLLNFQFVIHQCARSVIRNAVVAMALTLFSTPSISDFIEMLIEFVSVSVYPSFVTQVLKCRTVNVPKRAAKMMYFFSIFWCRRSAIGSYMLFC